MQHPLTLNTIEVFRSIQGESTWAGLPTTFIRLATCNLRCTWCDTTYSFGRGTSYTLNELIEQAGGFACPYVCITGGEPLLQENVHPLMKMLCDKGYKVSVETGGSLSIDRIDPRVKIILDIKCPGSTMHTKNYWSNLSLLKNQDEVKFVLLDRNDYDWAVGICNTFHLKEQCEHILFSPVHGQLDSQQLVEWILQDQLPVRLNLQIHKFVWDAQTRGV